MCVAATSGVCSIRVFHIHMHTVKLYLLVCMHIIVKCMQLLISVYTATTGNYAL